MEDLKSFCQLERWKGVGVGQKSPFHSLFKSFIYLNCFHVLSIFSSPLHLAVIHNQPEALYSLLSVVITIQDQNIVNQKNRLDQVTIFHLKWISFNC